MRFVYIIFVVLCFCVYLASFSVAETSRGVYDVTVFDVTAEKMT